eukprot:scaffold97816_cov59-Attheya_sp.AAC.2
MGGITVQQVSRNFKLTRGSTIMSLILFVHFQMITFVPQTLFLVGTSFAIFNVMGSIALAACDSHQRKHELRMKQLDELLLDQRRFQESIIATKTGIDRLSSKLETDAYEFSIPAF